ncbi:TetR/AcrR family transcriptional regulator [Streptacidiphilus sp. MAP5-3]|uniref:TetR/AcrR family transcriptional regulator n=1 Tax=unclassified Streptacidiphilus TaxID=2643834 RepID=UPI0035199497
MARPREHSDDDLLDRIGASLADASGSWTMAEAARAAGVHPATLVKRFGSWHGVLVALSRRWSAAVPEAPHTPQDRLGELRSWVDEVARPPQDRSHRVAGVAMLLEDLKDDELSQLLSEGWDRQIAYLTALVSGAHDDGHLTRSPDPRTAAALLLDLVNGFYLRAAASARSSATPDAAPQKLLNSLLESWT